MASSTVHQYFICHFCFDQFVDRASMLSHFSQCPHKNATKKPDEPIRLPRLNQTDRDMLQMLKLHRLNDKLISHPHHDKTNPYLQMPLSIGNLPASKQVSFDDAMCHHSTNSLVTNGNSSEQDFLSNTLNNKLSSAYHTYKYSRREQKNFYASVKRARLKKQYSSLRRTHPNSLIFKQTNFRLNLPTRLTARQRFNTNSNNSYPLIFDPNFQSLVQRSTHTKFQSYFSDMNLYFHLIHSIASQEFQIIVNSNDNEHHVSYTAFSFINILRQTMTDYTRNLQNTLKRNYFQTFQLHDQQVSAPVKIRRADQSIAARIQTEDNHRQQQHLPRQTEHILPATVILPSENNDVVVEPVQSELTIIDHRQPISRTNTEQILDSFISIVEQPKPNRSSSPIFHKEQKTEPIQNHECIFPSTKARIRIINGAHDHPKQSSPGKKLSNSINKLDENSLIRPTRMNTRKMSIKTEDSTEVCPPYQSIPVLLSSTEISTQWLTHHVFYRCHACSHEEFFVVLSRECMNLHISSKHGNMEENFKQRSSTFLTSKGRLLKIFQHYLKWQQPWSEKEVERIFKLSNK